MTYKINLEKVPLRLLYKLLQDTADAKTLIELLDIAVEDGVMNLPLTELPALMSNLMLELQKNNESIAIAIGSMKNFLENNGE